MPKISKPIVNIDFKHNSVNSNKESNNLNLNTENLKAIKITNIYD